MSGIWLLGGRMPKRTQLEPGDNWVQQPTIAECNPSFAVVQSQGEYVINLLIDACNDQYTLVRNNSDQKSHHMLYRFLSISLISIHVG